MPKPQQLVAKQKRPKNCTFCRNHDFVESKTGHLCKYRQCPCLLCQLTSNSQLVMKYQQALWRHQSRILAEHVDPQMRKLAKSRSQLCDKCRNHNKFVEKRGHKTKCEHENCMCVLCQLTNKRRLFMKYQQRVRRANITAKEVLSCDDESDEDQSEASSEQGCSQFPDASADNVVNSSHGVTELLDSISTMLDDFTRQFSSLKHEASMPVDDTPNQKPIQPSFVPVQSTSMKQELFHDEKPFQPSCPPLNESCDQSYERLRNFQAWDKSVDVSSSSKILTSIYQDQVKEPFCKPSLSDVRLNVRDYCTAEMGHQAHPFFYPAPRPHLYSLQQPQQNTITFHSPAYPFSLEASPTFSIPPQPREKLLLCKDASYQVWKRQYQDRNVAHFSKPFFRINGSLSLGAHYY